MSKKNPKQTDQSQSLLARRHSPARQAPSPGTHRRRPGDPNRGDGPRKPSGGVPCLQETAADPRGGGERQSRVAKLPLRRRLSGTRQSTLLCLCYGPSLRCE